MDARRRVLVTWAVAGGCGLLTIVAIALALPADSDASQPLVLPVPYETAAPAIPQARPIDDAPIDIPPQSGRGDPDGVVIDRTYLGESEAAFAYGTLTDGGNVCLAVHINNAGRTDVSCVPFAEFERSGVHNDLGYLEVAWYADGTVTWLT